MAGIGFPSVVANVYTVQYCGPWHTGEFRPQIATKKIIVPRIATVKCLNFRADCQGIIPLVANRGTLEISLPRDYFNCGWQWYWSAVCHKRVISSSSHFTSTVPLVPVPYLFWCATRVPSKQINFFSVRTETNRNSICFGSLAVCFVKLITIFFSLFRCFGPVSKQLKQTDMFRNKPKKIHKKQKNLRSKLHGKNCLKKSSTVLSN
jgi:hypothetical protein